MFSEFLLEEEEKKIEKFLKSIGFKKNESSNTQKWVVENQKYNIEILNVSHHKPTKKTNTLYVQLSKQIQKNTYGKFKSQINRWFSSRAKLLSAKNSKDESPSVNTNQLKDNAKYSQPTQLEKVKIFSEMSKVILYLLTMDIRPTAINQQTTSYYFKNCNSTMKEIRISDHKNVSNAEKYTTILYDLKNINSEEILLELKPILKKYAYDKIKLKKQPSSLTVQDVIVNGNDIHLTFKKDNKCYTKALFEIIIGDDGEEMNALKHFSQFFAV